jgi:excisionase family DNA binding protein
MDGDYISVNEAAVLKGVTRQRILQYINDGRLPAQKFADVYMIRREDVEAIELKAAGRPPKPKGSGMDEHVTVKSSKKGSKKAR